MDNAENRGFPRNSQKHSFGGKRDLIVFGIVSILAIIVLLMAGNRAITGKLINDWYYEEFELGDEDIQHAYELPPPAVHYLTPETMTFAVNRIPIHEFGPYRFIPIKEDDITTYSGSAEPYRASDVTHLRGRLCAYPDGFEDVPWRCEPVELGFSKDKVVWARGYAPDEYIGYQAVGRRMVTVWVLVTENGEILAISPAAFLRRVSD